MAKETRLIVATCVAPLVTATILGVLMSAFTFGVSSLAGLVLAVAMIGPIALFGLIGMLVFGLPAHALLQTTRYHGVVAYMLSGFVGGALLGGMMVGASHFFEPGAPPLQNELAINLPLPCAMGSVTAAVFWLIRRPDRDAPANPASTWP